MPVQIRDGSSWKTVGANGMWIRDGGSWKQAKAAWVRDGGSWKQVHQQSDPQTHTFQMLSWSQVYRGTGGVTSGRTGNADVAHFGYQYNSEIERSMWGASASEVSALAAFLAERPEVSSINAKLWTQHTQNSASKTAYLGVHSSSSRPSTFQRLHSENQSGWGKQITVPHNSSSGGNAFTVSIGVLSNWVNQMKAGTFRGMTISDESANSTSDWGWLAGDSYCTSESGGTCGGSYVSVPYGDTRATRLEITADYA